MNRKKWIARGFTLALLITIAAVMFVIGRGHTIYLDNKTAEFDGTEFSAFHRVNVTVNGERVAKLSARDRGMATWIGQHFKMELEITEKKGDDPRIVPVSITLPYGLDGIIVNLPELVAGLPQEVWQSEFIPAVPEEEEEEEVNIEDDIGLGDF